MKSDDRDVESERARFYTEHVERVRTLARRTIKVSGFSSVRRAHAITSISPATLLQHLIESFAGTGFERHLQFVENTQALRPTIP